jgi:hypothetical protein
MAAVQPIAIGLVHADAGARSTNRWWYRAIVVRHAHDRRLRLVDVLELDDDGRTNAQELLRLAAIAAQSDATVLVTHGIRPELARSLAADLGLRHLPAPDRPSVPGAEETQAP